MPFLLGKKIEMTQVFNQEGKVIPVTLVEAGPCVICQVKNKEKDGYEAVQVGFKQKTKHLKKAENKKPFKILKEFRIETKEQTAEKIDLGDEFRVDVFKEGDTVKVSAISKGKGFQGGVKRWGFKGRNQTHGVKHEHRTLGSVGATGPARVLKGKKMPGQTGFQRTTIKNLKVIKIDKENNVLAIKGAIPGRRGTLVEISS